MRPTTPWLSTNQKSPSGPVVSATSLVQHENPVVNSVMGTTGEGEGTGDPGPGDAAVPLLLLQPTMRTDTITSGKYAMCETRLILTDTSLKSLYCSNPDLFGCRHSAPAMRALTQSYELL